MGEKRAYNNLYIQDRYSNNRNKHINGYGPLNAEEG